jgi:hypothetical protein
MISGWEEKVRTGSFEKIKELENLTHLSPSQDTVMPIEYVELYKIVHINSVASAACLLHIGISAKTSEKVFVNIVLIGRFPIK